MLKDERAEMEGGLPTLREPGGPAAARFCSVPGCGGRHLARGFCVRHYYQVKRNGSVRPEGGRACRPCRVSPPRMPGGRPAFRVSREELCGELSCSEMPFSRGLCRLHYIMTRSQDLLS